MRTFLLWCKNNDLILNEKVGSYTLCDNYFHAVISFCVVSGIQSPLRGDPLEC